MYFVPLSQLESVELVIHSLKAAAGEAECRQCPAYRVCTKQCLTISMAIEQMLRDGKLPQLGLSSPPSEKPQAKRTSEKSEGAEQGAKGRLKLVKKED